jgi:polysaccharide export outer membrane protein
MPANRPFKFMNPSPLLRFVLLGLLALSGVRAEPPENSTPPTNSQIKPRDNSYVLRPNDGIKLDVYEESDLSVGVRILKTGEASFPLIGSVQLAGLSVAAAATRIRELLAKDYLVDPKVTLSVTDYATEFISVIGEVRSPGQVAIPVAGNLDLATVMATVGGVSANADANRILLVRASGATAYYAMASINTGESGRVKLMADDRIIVNQSAFAGKSLTMLGQVGRQGPLAFPPSGKLDLVNAIAMAGGLTPLANPKKVTINRKGVLTVVDYKEISQRGDRPYPLQPDDIVIVAERWL